MAPQRTAVLLKDLPNCPKGRIFKEKLEFDEFYPLLTDEEAAHDKFKWYEFSSAEVEQNPDWFQIL